MKIALNGKIWRYTYMPIGLQMEMLTDVKIAINLIFLEAICDFLRDICGNLNPYIQLRARDFYLNTLKTSMFKTTLNNSPYTCFPQFIFLMAG